MLRELKSKKTQNQAAISIKPQKVSLSNSLGEDKTSSEKKKSDTPSVFTPEEKLQGSDSSSSNRKSVNQHLISDFEKGIQKNLEQKADKNQPSGKSEKERDDEYNLKFFKDIQSVINLIFCENSADYINFYSAQDVLNLLNSQYREEQINKYETWLMEINLLKIFNLNDSVETRQIDSSHNRKVQMSEKKISATNTKPNYPKSFEKEVLLNINFEMILKNQGFSIERVFLEIFNSPAFEDSDKKSKDSSQKNNGSNNAQSSLEYEIVKIEKKTSTRESNASVNFQANLAPNLTKNNSGEKNQSVNSTKIQQVSPSLNIYSNNTKTANGRVMKKKDVFAVVTLCPPDKDPISNSHFKPKKLPKNLSTDSDPSGRYLEDHPDGEGIPPPFIKTNSESRSDFYTQSK